MPKLQWTVEEAARRAGVTSAAQLAQLAKLAQGTATGLWHGRPLRVDLDTLQRVCDALDCTPNDLLGARDNDVVGKIRASERAPAFA